MSSRAILRLGGRVIPLHKRISLLVRSRTKGLGGVVAFMMLMALTVGGNDFVFWTAGMAVAYIAIPLILAADHTELTGSDAALWLHKPVHEVPYVLASFAETLAATVGLALLFGTAWVVSGLALGWETVRSPVLTLPVGALASVAIVSMAFGTAAWLPRGSRAAVVGLIVLGHVVFGPEISQPELVRGGPVLLARLVLFPVPDILRFGLGLTGDLPFRIQPLLAMLAYSLGWIAVGALGIWRSVATGRIGYS